MDQDSTWFGGKASAAVTLCYMGPCFLPPPKKKWGGTAAHHFSAHAYCDQTAGWIKMPLGTEVGFGPCDIVLDEDPAPPQKRAEQPPLFGPCLLWSNGHLSQQLVQFDVRCKR